MKELQRLYNRAVPVFDTYKRVQTKYLQNLTDLPHDPIEFSLKNPPAEESKFTKKPFSKTIFNFSSGYQNTNPKPDTKRCKND